MHHIVFVRDKEKFGRRKCLTFNFHHIKFGGGKWWIVEHVLIFVERGLNPFRRPDGRRISPVHRRVRGRSSGP